MDGFLITKAFVLVLVMVVGWSVGKLLGTIIWMAIEKVGGRR